MSKNETQKDGHKNQKRHTCFFLGEDNISNVFSNISCPQDRRPASSELLGLAEKTAKNQRNRSCSRCGDELEREAGFHDPVPRGVGVVAADVGDDRINAEECFQLN